MISLFLAKFLGTVLVVVALALLVNPKGMQSRLGEVVNTHGVMTVSGFGSFLVGLLIVLLHNIWIASWVVVITIIGWLIVVRGLVRIFFPTVSDDFAKKFVEHKPVYFVTAVVFLLVGLYLVYHGFFF